jgi:hypothetical protein
VVDALGRLSRAVRRLAARRETGALDAAGHAASRQHRGIPDRDRQSRYCRASGWRLRASCTDLDGDTICPLCSRSVRTHPDDAVRYAVQVIPDHVA